VGKRSRKRAVERGTTRAERDAARRAKRTLTASEAAPARKRPGRPSIDERPQAPWGEFPLSELVILLGIILITWGLFTGRAGNEKLIAGIALAALGGGELALREHLAGFRSHTTLLAGVASFAVVTVVALGLGPVKLYLLVPLGVAIFAGAFYLLRELFKKRSGGLGFR
jgi:hypothetical protein